ncbi:MULTISPECIES: hypothetical protein [Niastella]|uniref:Uncharacterized protein n=1 Tax=Niastella soli TaxID=2821487 RepID=A0ABS3Z4I9_9BACT|nr:hypothetical protein [Niastella soli]MBO9205082.1 hypothetical protein [Niastella soli]
MDEKKLKEELPHGPDPHEDEDDEREYDIIDELTPQQLAQLAESIKQAEAGNTIPHEKAMELMSALVNSRSRQNL